MSTLQSKHVWLIGASEGIGRETAKALAAAGTHLTLSARQLPRLQELAAEIGGNCQIVACDITNADEVQVAWQRVQAFAPLDVLLFNAGTYEPMPATAFDLPRAQHMVQVNFMAILPILSHIIPAFIARRAGHIALVASVAGYRGLPDAIGYGASKAALIHLAENLKCDLRSHGIKVQVINPGFVATRLTAKNDFKMPGIISAPVAARHIVQGLQSQRFEIRFPWLFSSVLKLLRLLPYGLYFRLVSKS